MSSVSSTVAGGQAIYSPSDQYLAGISGGTRLTIRNSVTLEIVHIYQCIDKIEKFEFSPDSCFIQCGLYSRNAIQVFSLSDKDFKCRINEGVAGMINSWWLSDSRTIIVESDFGIQLAFWSLVDSTSSIVSLPKPCYASGKTMLSQVVAYSDVSPLVAVVHRIELQDYIGVYAHGQSPALAEVAKFRAKSNDIAYIRWMAGDSHIITVDSPLTYKLCVYTPSGELVANFEAYQHALGIRSLALPPLKGVAAVDSDCSLLAVGSFDGKVRVLSAYSWQLAFTLPLVHPRDMDVSINPDRVVTTVEVAESAGATGGLEFASADLTSRSGTLNSSSVFRVGALPSEPSREIAYVQRMVKALPRVAVDPRSNTKSGGGAFPPMGASWIQFSGGCEFLAAREEAHPRCLWVWSPVQSRLVALLVQLEAVSCAQWRPAVAYVTGSDSTDNSSDTGVAASQAVVPLLAFCSGNSRVYFWNSFSGVTWTDVAAADSEGPPGVVGRGMTSVVSLQWNGAGTQLLLRGKEAHCTCDVDLSGFLRAALLATETATSSVGHAAVRQQAPTASRIVVDDKAVKENEDNDDDDEFL